ncbi:MAG: hypothetical protein FRX49_10098 [Trebouxia sp. A1-2]|nr:MAG: hypothetical protein FRX49_10098 [Trebouxia sp. A1-2]
MSLGSTHSTAVKGRSSTLTRTGRVLPPICITTGKSAEWQAMLYPDLRGGAPQQNEDVSAKGGGPDAQHGGPLRPHLPERQAAAVPDVCQEECVAPPARQQHRRPPRFDCWAGSNLPPSLLPQELDRLKRLSRCVARCVTALADRVWVGLLGMALGQGSWMGLWRAALVWEDGFEQFQWGPPCLMWQGAGGQRRLWGATKVFRLGSVLQRSQREAARQRMLTVALLLMREGGGTSLPDRAQPHPCLVQPSLPQALGTEQLIGDPLDLL